MGEPTCVSLFSGIGGLDEGLRRAGFRHVLMCELEPWRRAVLRERFPGVPVWDDVRVVAVDGGRAAEAAADLRLAGGRRERQELGRQSPLMDSRSAGADSGAVGMQDAGDLDSPDLLAGGTPCQDLSVAGRRAGLGGERSGLFFEYARVADALRPRWLLWENVPGALSSQGGRDFGCVLGTLADIGYGLAWRVLDSRFFGVPQRRRRVFVVGARADGDPRAAAERAGEVLAVGTRCLGHPATGGEAREEVAVASLSGIGTGGPDDNDGQGGRLIASHQIAPSLDKGAGDGPRRNQDAPMVAFHPTQDQISNPISHALGSEPTGSVAVSYALSAKASYHDGDANTTYAMNGASVRRLTPTECARLQGLPDDWFDGVPGTSDSKMYAGLGDAVTVNAAQWIGGRIVAAC